MDYWVRNPEALLSPPLQYSITPLLHYFMTPLPHALIFHYSIFLILFHYSNTPLIQHSISLDDIRFFQAKEILLAQPDVTVDFLIVFSNEGCPPPEATCNR